MLFLIQLSFSCNGRQITSKKKNISVVIKKKNFLWSIFMEQQSSTELQMNIDVFMGYQEGW